MWETESRGHNREVQESKTHDVVWSRKEARPRIRRKKDSGDGTTWVNKKRKAEAEMDGLCQPRHESHRNDERWSPWQIWLEENCVCRSNPTTKWERLEEEERLDNCPSPRPFALGSVGGGGGYFSSLVATRPSISFPVVLSSFSLVHDHGQTNKKQCDYNYRLIC